MYSPQFLELLTTFYIIRYICFFSFFSPFCTRYIFKLYIERYVSNDTFVDEELFSSFRYLQSARNIPRIISFTVIIYCKYHLPLQIFTITIKYRIK